VDLIGEEVALTWVEVEVGSTEVEAVSTVEKEEEGEVASTLVAGH